MMERRNLLVIIGVGAGSIPTLLASETGRSYERFALQTTSLGIRNAFVNQPVEVAAVRPQFASWLGLAPSERADLIVRFGRGPTLPLSMRRPVQEVLV